MWKFLQWNDFRPTCPSTETPSKFTPLQATYWDKWIGWELNSLLNLFSHMVSSELDTGECTLYYVQLVLIVSSYNSSTAGYYLSSKSREKQLLNKTQDMTSLPLNVNTLIAINSCLFIRAEHFHCLKQSVFYKRR
jgi:hypothetical protein